MKDMIPKGTGNSRFLRSVGNFKVIYPTYDDFVNALVAGNLPVDFNGINDAGIQQVGTPLNKANLLTDETAAALGLTGEDPTVNEALRQISTPQSGTGTLYVYCKDEAGEPVSGCVVQIGEEVAVTSASGAVKYFLAPGTYSVSIRSPIDYGAESQTVNVAVALSEIASVEATIQDSLNGATEVDFTSSVTAAFSDRVASADVFGVGAGGSGGLAYVRGSSNLGAAASGGAGGKTKTVKNLDIRQLMSITVGAGGAGVSLSGTSKANNATSGKDGGTTIIKTSAGNTLLSAQGGKGGSAGIRPSVAQAPGADGGSGSGGAVGQYSGNGVAVGPAGVDGNSGGSVSYSTVANAPGGSGQGSTTRAFGEADGELFANAGGSIGRWHSTEVKNTPGTGAGAAAGGHCSSANGIECTAGAGTVPGCGGGAVAVSSDSSSYPIDLKSGAGANGLVRFRWEVA